MNDKNATHEVLYFCLYILYFKNELQVLCLETDILDIFQFSNVYITKIHARSWIGGHRVLFLNVLILWNTPVVKQNVLSSLGS